MVPSIASAVIASQFPHLAPVRAVPLGEGCDSIAFAVNGDWVFRFPKNDETAAQFAVEARLLSRLARRLPIAVPSFEFVGLPSAEFPRAFCGYARLPGEPAIRLSREIPGQAIAGAIARFLSALHALPLDEAIGAGVPRQPLAPTLEDLRADALSDLERVPEVDPAAPMERWRAFLASPPDAGDEGTAVLLHNDFAAEHVLVDRGEVTGVIDWTDAAIGARVFDFAGLFHWGGDAFAGAVLAVYEGPFDERTLTIARYLAACRGAMDVAFGLENARPEYVVAGLRALRYGARR